MIPAEVRPYTAAVITVMPQVMGVPERPTYMCPPPIPVPLPHAPHAFRRRELGRALQIQYAQQSGTSYPGSIYPYIAMPLEQTAGFVPENGDPLADWVIDWVNAPVRLDNLTKLARSGCYERHLT